MFCVLVFFFLVSGFCNDVYFVGIILVTCALVASVWTNVTGCSKTVLLQ
jgi:hypothetical protein